MPPSITHGGKSQNAARTSRTAKLASGSVKFAAKCRIQTISLVASRTAELRARLRAFQPRDLVVHLRRGFR
ncbi:MAG TPA: hypothetical protein VGL73_02690 [Caulobacteraceae bacterium]|jgi:hypothetical protein